MRALLRLFYTICLDEVIKDIDANEAELKFVVRFFRYKVYTLRKK
jgi:hypothetical protein